MLNGVSPNDGESKAPHVAGFIVREQSPIASNWRAEGTLRDYLVANHIVAISDIDTRALTRVLRSAGVMRGVMATGEPLQIPRHLDVATVYGYIALPGNMNPGEALEANLNVFTVTAGGRVKF